MIKSACAMGGLTVGFLAMLVAMGRGEWLLAVLFTPLVAFLLNEFASAVEDAS